MPLVDSLLTAIVRADGDALVLHAGERPYVVAPSGQSELASRVLTLEAMIGMLGELLPQEGRKTLEELGAVQHDLPASGSAGGERFTVIAARGGNDIWIEIRRHRRPPVAQLVREIAAPPPMRAPEPVPEEAPVETIEVERERDVEREPVRPVQPGFTPEPEPEVEVTREAEPAPDAPIVPEVAPEPAPAYAVSERLVEPVTEPDHFAPAAQAEEQPGTPFGSIDDDASDEGEEISLDVEISPAPIEAPPPAARPAPPPLVAVAPPPPPEPPAAAPPPPPVAAAPPPPPPPPPPAAMAPPAPSAPVAPPAPAASEVEPRPAVVLPLSRQQVRGDQAARFTPVHTTGIDRLLRIAAARGASTLYLTSQARPSIRVDGEISAVEGEAVLSESDVEALILDIIPERNRETLRSQVGTEWISDVADVGRIRCVTFRDHRGAGGIFRMIPARAISAEQLGLSREIQGLCGEAEGLVLVAGPRASGKSTLIAAFVDLINRTRSDHVITLENQIKFVHENRGSLVSQREVRGDTYELLAVARAALRENPDVLVIQDFGSPEIVLLALEAAHSGHLVIGALTAHTATDAVDRIIDQTPPEQRAKVQLGLAENLRGIVAQVLLRKSGGGRVAAREVLLNTSAVANLIAEGKTSQLPMALDSGRKHGMVALNDALVAFVQNGIVDSREAYRHASDRPSFLGLLKRQGIDTSFVERLA